jgi:hypothetical protein
LVPTVYISTWHKVECAVLCQGDHYRKWGSLGGGQPPSYQGCCDCGDQPAAVTQRWNTNAWWSPQPCPGSTWPRGLHSSDSPAWWSEFLPKWNPSPGRTCTWGLESGGGHWLGWHDLGRSGGAQRQPWLGHNRQEDRQVSWPGEPSCRVVVLLQGLFPQWGIW